MNSGPRDERYEGIGIFHSVTALINIFLSGIFQFGRSVVLLITERVDRQTVAEAVDTTLQALSDHPLLGISLCGCAVVCTIPVLTLITIVVSSLCFTFFGFVLIEGFILVAALLFFIPCFIAVIIFMIAVACGLIGVYVTGLFLGRVLTNGRKYSLRVHRQPIEE